MLDNNSVEPQLEIRTMGILIRFKAQIGYIFPFEQKLCMLLTVAKGIMLPW